MESHGFGISVVFAPSAETPELIQLAEELGFHRAWVFDSPAVYADCWMTLAAAATRTNRIGLGTMVIPSVRHPVVTAAAAATLESMAPGRTAMILGSGFSARFALDDPKPMKWADVEEYALAVQQLLRGETAEWQGHVLSLLHSEGFAASRPMGTPILIAAEGPKGLAVARVVGEGVCSQFESLTDEKLTEPWVTVHAYALVLKDGETLHDSRVFETMGWLPALYHHVAYERALPYEDLPGGADWRERLEKTPERTRHLSIHRRHMEGLNELDEGIVTPDVVARTLPSMAIVGSMDDVARRFQGYGDRGVDELMMYVPRPHARRTLLDLAEARQIALVGQ